MSEEQSDKLKLKATDTNRFKIEVDQPTEQPAAQLPKTDEEPAKIDDVNAQRKVNTGSFKRIDVTGQAPSSTTAVPGMGDGGVKKSETVRLKVVRATPAGGAPTASPAASTVKLNLKRPDAPAPAVSGTPASAASTLKLRPTTPPSAQPAEPSQANTPTTKVPVATPPAEDGHPKLSIKKEETPTPAPAPAPAEPKADATTAVPPPAEPAAKPALKLNKPKKEAAATVAVEPPAPEAEKPAEEKKEEAKPVMKMKGAAAKDDDVDKYLPQQDDDDEPGALEGVAAVIAFLATGFATYQLVMNFLQQIQ